MKQPSAIDYAYLAIAYAQLGQIEKTAEAADEVRRSSPSWIAEVYLSESGGYQDREAERFIEGARRAGFNACAPARAIVNDPRFIPVKSCNAWRAKLPG